MGRVGFERRVSNLVGGTEGRELRGSMKMRENDCEGGLTTGLIRRVEKCGRAGVIKEPRWPSKRVGTAMARKTLGGTRLLRVCK
jgi:hypothetical protein